MRKCIEYVSISLTGLAVPSQNKKAGTRSNFPYDEEKK